MGTWTYDSSCPDSFGFVVDDEEKTTTAADENGDAVSVPLYRLEGIDPKIALSDGVRVFVAERFSGKAMPKKLRRLLADE